MGGQSGFLEVSVI